jgi:hypothetical protein
MTDKLTQNKLKEILNYDNDNGIFTWKINPARNVNCGDIAGSLTVLGYIHITINKKTYKAHRLAWLYVYGKWPDKNIDHINRNRSDNKICNLREVNVSENGWNVGIASDNTSGYKGVYWRKDDKKWAARIQVNGKRKYLGGFENSIQAANAYRIAEIEYFGVYALGR